MSGAKKQDVLLAQTVLCIGHLLTVLSMMVAEFTAVGGKNAIRHIEKIFLSTATQL
jgi:hypothetical protein